MLTSEQLKQANEQFLKQVVICDTCEERMEHKLYYAKEHLEKFPTHTRYRIILKSDDNKI